MAVNQNHPLDKAIGEVLTTLRQLMGDKAESALRDVVDTSLERVLGASAPPAARKGRAPVAASPKKPPHAAPAKKPAGGGGTRGPKPGGRQLKAHIGPKAYEALDGETKDKGRSVIAKLGAAWNALSKEEKEDKLSGILKKAAT